MEKSKERMEIERVIENYYDSYNLPPIKITEKEWSAFYSVLEDHFNKKGISDQYIHALNIIIRKALFYASFKGEDAFTINHLLKALEDLIAFNIYSKERDEIKTEILNTSYEKPVNKETNKEDELITLLNSAIKEELEEDKVSKELTITQEEWLTAFKVIEAHYIANNKMDHYLTDLKFYIKNVVYWSNWYDDIENASLLCGFAIDSLYAIIDTEELVSIADEIYQAVKNKGYTKHK